MTSVPPYQSTSANADSPRNVTRLPNALHVRVLMSCRSSIAFSRDPYRARSSGSRPNACTVRMPASDSSAATFDSAHASCSRFDRRSKRSPKRTAATITGGTARSMTPASRACTARSTPTAPTRTSDCCSALTKLRVSAAPIAPMSALRRERRSPTRCDSKKEGVSVSRCA